MMFEVRYIRSRRHGYGQDNGVLVCIVDAICRENAVDCILEKINAGCDERGSWITRGGGGKDSPPTPEWVPAEEAGEDDLIVRQLPLKDGIWYEEVQYRD